MLEYVYLPKLNCLSPSMDSTILKIVEESGELARSVLLFLPYEKESAFRIHHNPEARELLSDVVQELLDVAQTCVTMLFVLEEKYSFSIDEWMVRHLNKLEKKGYLFDRQQNYRIVDNAGFKQLALPHLGIANVTLLKTVCKIQEEVGELTQFVGKKRGASGERERIGEQEAMEGCGEELLDIAQCCFTMFYILSKRYRIDLRRCLKSHVDKLAQKGYWSPGSVAQTIGKKSDNEPVF